MSMGWKRIRKHLASDAARLAEVKIARREAWLARRYRIWRFGLAVTFLVGVALGMAVRVG